MLIGRANAKNVKLSFLYTDTQTRSVTRSRFFFLFVFFLSRGNGSEAMFSADRCLQCNCGRSAKHRDQPAEALGRHRPSNSPGAGSTPRRTTSRTHPRSRTTFEAVGNFRQVAAKTSGLLPPRTSRRLIVIDYIDMGTEKRAQTHGERTP